MLSLKYYFLVYLFLLGGMIMGCQSEDTLSPKPQPQPSETEVLQQVPETLTPPPDINERTATQGWQLLSPPVNTTVAPEAFLNKYGLGGVQRIFGWNATSEKWQIYPHKPEYTNYEALEHIEPNTAYWFLTTLPIQFSSEGALQRNFAFHSGWNLVGFSSGNSPIDVTAFFTDGANGSLLSSIESVWLWKHDHWQVWASGWNAQTLEEYQLDALTAITPGQGFWVKYNQPSSTTFTYQPSIQTSKAFFEEFRNVGLSYSDLTEELKATGSAERYSEVAQQFEEELNNLPDLKNASARFTTALRQTSESITQDANKNLVAPNSFQNREVVVEGNIMYLDATYSSETPNNLTVSWTLKNATSQTSGYDFGSYQVSGDNPLKKGAIDFEATVLNYQITSERITYNLGEAALNDTSVTAKNTDLQFELSNFALTAFVNNEVYQMNWEQGTITAHYETEIVDGIEKIVDEKSHVTQLVLVGSLQTPRAILTGKFNYTNTSNSVSALIPYVEELKFYWYRVTTRKMDLFDSIEFEGTFQYRVSGEKVHIGLALDFSPNQKAYLPLETEIVTGTANYASFYVDCEGISYRLYQPGDSLTCLNGQVHIERFASHTDGYHEYYSPAGMRLTTSEKPDSYFKTKVRLKGQMDSFLSSQYKGYQFEVTIDRTDYRAGVIDLALSSTDHELTFQIPTHLNEKTQKLVTSNEVALHFRSPTLHFEAMVSADNQSGSILFQNDWLTIDLADSDLDNPATRDIGTIKNLDDESIATVEYNRDLGVRAKYTDSSFETLVVIPPRFLEETLTIEGPELLEVIETGDAFFKATAQFSDGKTRTVNAEWQVNDTSIASIQFGRLFTKRIFEKKTVTIIAQYKKQKVAKQLTIVPVAPEQLRIIGRDSFVENSWYFYYRYRVEAELNGQTYSFYHALPWEVDRPDLLTMDYDGYVRLEKSIEADTQFNLSVTIAGVSATKTITIHPEFLLSMSGPETTTESMNVTLQLQKQPFGFTSWHNVTADSWEVDQTNVATITSGTLVPADIDANTTVKITAHYRGKSTSKNITIVPNLMTLSEQSSMFEFDQSNNRLFTLSDDKRTLSVVNLIVKSVEKTFTFDSEVSAITLTPNNEKLLVAMVPSDSSKTEGGKVVELDLNQLTKSQEIELTISPSALIAISDNQFVIGSTLQYPYTNYIQLYNMDSASRLSSLEIDWPINTISWYPKQQWIYASSGSRLIKYELSGNEIHYMHSTYGGTSHSNLEIIPQEEVLISQSTGSLYQISDQPKYDLLLSRDLSDIQIRDIGTDFTNQILFTLEKDDYSNQHYLRYYNTRGFELIHEMPIPGDYDYIFPGKGDQFLLAQVSENTTYISQHTHVCTQCSESHVPQVVFTVSPESGNIATEYLFDASNSTDIEDTIEHLQFRWDWESDGEYDTEFSNNAQISKQFEKGGSKIVTLQVKDQSGLASTNTQLVFVSTEAAPGGSTPYFELPSAPDSVVFDETRMKMYLIDSDFQRLYIVDLTTGKIDQYLDFPYIPLKLFIRPKLNKLFLSSKYPNSPYLSTRPIGVITEFNLETFSQTNEFDISVIATDLVATSNGKTVVYGNDKLQAYDSNTGSLLGSEEIGFLRGLVLHPNGQWVYVTLYHRMKKYDIQGEGLSLLYDKSFQDDFELDYDNDISPAGDYIVEYNTGNVFSISEEEEHDLKFIKDLTSDRVDAIAFDIENNFLITIETYSWNKQYLRYYNLTTFLKAGEILLDFSSSVRFVSVTDEFIFSITYNGTTVFQEPHPCPNCGKSTTPTAMFSAAPELTGDTATYFQLDATASTDSEDPNSHLQFRWDWNSDGNYDTPFLSEPLFTKKFAIVGSYSVTLQVMDSSGLVSTHTETLEVSQGTDYGHTIAESTPFVLPFEATDFIVDEKHNKFFALDETDKRLYIGDLSTGLLERYFEFEHTPQLMRLSPNGAHLYLGLTIPITFDDQQIFGNMVELDLTNLAVTSQFETQYPPLDFNFWQEKLIIYGNGYSYKYNIPTGWQVYDPSTQALLQTTNYGTGSLYGMTIHPTQNWLYYTSSSGVGKFSINEDYSLTSLRFPNYSSRWDLDNTFSIAPNGEFLIEWNTGEIFNTSETQEMFLQRDLSNNHIPYVKFDSQNNILFTIEEYYQNGRHYSLFAYNYLTFRTISKLDFQQKTHKIFVTNDSIYGIQIDGNTKIMVYNHPCPRCGESTAPTANLKVTPNAEGTTATTFLFDASASSDSEDAFNDLQFRWDWDSDGVYDTNFSNTPQISRQFSLAGTKKVTLEVKDTSGLISVDSFTFNVSREEGELQNGDGVFELQFPSEDMLYAPSQKKLYVTDKPNQRLVFVDFATGFHETQIEFDYSPERIVFSADQSQLIVALTYDPYTNSPEEDRGFIAIIDLNTKTKIKEFEIETLPFDLAVSNSNTLYVSAKGPRQIFAYNIMQGALLDSTSTYRTPSYAYLALHTEENWLYAQSRFIDGSQLTKFTLSDSTVTYAHALSHYLSRSWGILRLSLDGKYLFAGQGEVYQTSSNESDDINYIKDLTDSTFTDIAFDTDKLRMFTVETKDNYSSLEYFFNTYDLESLSRTDKVPLTHPGKFVFQDQSTVYVAIDSDGTTKLLQYTAP